MSVGVVALSEDLLIALVAQERTVQPMGGAEFIGTGEEYHQIVLLSETVHTEIVTLSQPDTMELCADQARLQHAPDQAHQVFARGHLAPAERVPGRQELPVKGFHDALI